MSTVRPWRSKIVELEIEQGITSINHPPPMLEIVLSQAQQLTSAAQLHWVEKLLHPTEDDLWSETSELQGNGNT